jgi:ribose 5-phosphate isomerase RpiB
MKIAMGCDHGGYALKEDIKNLLTGKGYEVQYSTDKKFKKSAKTVKIKKNKTTKTTIKKLKKGTWYVRIRTVNGKKTSAWSKSKSVKVK